MRGRARTGELVVAKKFVGNLAELVGSKTDGCEHRREVLVGGGALPVDMHTTTVVLLGFPPLLILWKAVQDDAAVNWIETVTMMAIFSLTIYFLAAHG